MPEPTDSTTILAALDAGIEDCETLQRLTGLEKHLTSKQSLQALRARIEKERPFLKAAMTYCEIAQDHWISPTPSKAPIIEARRKLVAAFRALTSEKPPEKEKERCPYHSHVYGCPCGQCDEFPCTCEKSSERMESRVMTDAGSSKVEMTTDAALVLAMDAMEGLHRFGGTMLGRDYVLATVLVGKLRSRLSLQREKLEALRDRILKENGCDLAPDCSEDCVVCSWARALDSILKEEG